VRIPKGDYDKPEIAPAWLPIEQRNEAGELVPSRPIIRCACGRLASIPLHHVHADGRVTASFLEHSCGFHEFLELGGLRRPGVPAPPMTKATWIALLRRLVSAGGKPKAYGPPRPRSTQRTSPTSRPPMSWSSVARCCPPCSGSATCSARGALPTDRTPNRPARFPCPLGRNRDLRTRPRPPHKSPCRRHAESSPPRAARSHRVGPVGPSSTRHVPICPA